jgi:hypothetical protein
MSCWGNWCLGSAVDGCEKALPAKANSRVKMKDNSWVKTDIVSASVGVVGGEKLD